MISGQNFIELCNPGFDPGRNKRMFCFVLFHLPTQNAIMLPQTNASHGNDIYHFLGKLSFLSRARYCGAREETTPPYTPLYEQQRVSRDKAVECIASVSIHIISLHNMDAGLKRKHFDTSDPEDATNRKVVSHLFSCLSQSVDVIQFLGICTRRACE